MSGTKSCHIVGLAMVVALSFASGVLAQDDTTPTATTTASPSPTATVTPSSTITLTPTASITTSPIPTATAMATATHTVTATQPPSATATPISIIETVVITQAPVVVTLPVIITAPPVVITSVPATARPATSNSGTTTITRAQPAIAPTQLTPFYGWQRYESIHLIEVVGRWRIRQHSAASSQQYREGEVYGATVRYPFQGDGIRIAYLAQQGGCRFDVVVDGIVHETLDSHSNSDDPQWRMAGAYFLTGGYHVLDIRAHSDRPCTTAIDYMDIFTNAPLPIVPTNASGNQNVVGSNVGNSTNERDITQITLLSEPATATPQPTVVPMGRVQLQVQVAIDKNANGEADLDEGVRAVSVRLVDADSGALIASGFTDQRGRVTFDVSTNSDIVAHVPLLAETFRLRVRVGDVVDERWLLLLAGVNQPAVMP